MDSARQALSVPPPLEPGSVQAMLLHRLWTGVQSYVDYPSLADFVDMISLMQHLTRSGVSWEFSAPNDHIAGALLAAFPDGRYVLNEVGHRVVRFGDPEVRAVSCQWNELFDYEYGPDTYGALAWRLDVEDLDALGEVPLDVVLAAIPVEPEPKD